MEPPAGGNSYFAGGVIQRRGWSRHDGIERRGEMK
jgi:hypothetical protein